MLFAECVSAKPLPDPRHCVVVRKVCPANMRIRVRMKARIRARIRSQGENQGGNEGENEGGDEGGDAAKSKQSHLYNRI